MVIPVDNVAGVNISALLLLSFSLLFNTGWKHIHDE